MLDQRAKHRRGVPALRVVQVVPREGLAVVLEDGHQFAAGQLVAHLVLVDDGEPDTVAREVDVDRRVSGEHATRGGDDDLAPRVRVPFPRPAR